MARYIPGLAWVKLGRIKNMTVNNAVSLAIGNAEYTL